MADVAQIASPLGALYLARVLTLAGAPDGPDSGLEPCGKGSMSKQDPVPDDSDWTEIGLEAYEPPRIAVLGTLSDLTQGRSSTARTDGTFPGSIFT
jgi:hypothetical protein